MALAAFALVFGVWATLWIPAMAIRIIRIALDRASRAIIHGELPWP